MDFHFWNYKPVTYANVMDTTGYCTMVTIKKYKHLNFYALGIETAILGITALLLRGFLRRHER